MCSKVAAKCCWCAWLRSSESARRWDRALFFVPQDHRALSRKQRG
ncbi:hypothetical protein [Lysobacter gummosus]